MNFLKNKKVVVIMCFILSAIFAFNNNIFLGASTKKTKVTKFYLGEGDMYGLEVKYKKTWPGNYFGYEIGNFRFSNNKVLKSANLCSGGVDVEENSAWFDIYAKHTGKVTVFADIIGWNEGYIDDQGEWISGKISTKLLTVKKTVMFVKYRNPFKKFSVGKRNCKKKFNNGLADNIIVKKGFKGKVNIKLKKGFKFSSKKNGISGAFIKNFGKPNEVYKHIKNIKNHKLFKAKFNKGIEEYLIFIDVYDKKNKMKRTFTLCIDY